MSTARTAMERAHALGRHVVPRTRCAACRAERAPVERDDRSTVATWEQVCAAAERVAQGTYTPPAA